MKFEAIKNKRIICSECGCIFDDTETFEVHATVEHCDWKPYLCSHCPNDFFPTENICKRHCKWQHPGDRVQISRLKNSFKDALLASIITDSSSDDSSCENLTEPSVKIKAKQPVAVIKSAPVVDGSEPSRITLKRGSRTVYGGTPVPTANKFCRLCQKEVTKYPKGAHVWLTHIRKPIYVCTYCDYPLYTPNVAKMLVHNRTHRGMEMSMVNHKDVYQEEHERLRVECFGHSIAAASADQRSPFKYCNLCKDGHKIRRATEHVLHYHLNETIYRCSLCNYTHKYSQYFAKFHLKRQHTGSDGYIENNVRKYAVAIRGYLKECFSEITTKMKDTGNRTRAGVDMVVWYTCERCSKKVGNGRQSEHVYRHLHHDMGKARFLCTVLIQMNNGQEQCLFGADKQTGMHSHLMRLHGLKSSSERFTSYTDKREELKSEFDKLFKECFK